MAFTTASMESVLLAALLAASSPAAAAPAPLDLRCFALMAELAEDDDPRVAGAGRIAAQYFLGRIDAAEPDFNLVDSPAAPEGAARARLLRQCGDAMESGGLDFRALDRALAPPSRPTI